MCYVHIKFPEKHIRPECMYVDKFRFTNNFDPE